MKRLLKKILRFFGYSLIKINSNSTDDINKMKIPKNTIISMHPHSGKISYMITPNIISYMIDDMVSISEITISNFFKPIVKKNRVEIEKIVRDFIDLYSNRPIKINKGGASFHNCFWLYITCCCFQPELIVESGVWKGQTSWVLINAAPNAEIHCFDIDLSNLVYKNRNINYHENDWSSYDFGNIQKNLSLIHFDDHINQAKRVREAYEKGFLHLLFDDNLPVYQIYKDNKSIIPTIDMLFDSNVQTDQKIEWFNNGFQSHLYKKESNYNAKAIIKKWSNFPTIDPESTEFKARLGGSGANSKFAYVQIIDNQDLMI